jgi:alkaline phosphatase D
MKTTSRRQFLTQSASLAAIGGVATLAACSSSSGTPAQFLYGVASGDPLADRVILWTHAKRANDLTDVKLTWQIATDNGFTNIVNSGTVVAGAATDYTAKIDAIGLSAGTTYYYRFLDETNTSSTLGTTRTLPTSGATSVKLAVFSCTHYSAGFFNVYESAVSSGAEYALHLGDYIYEYGAAANLYGNTDNTTTPAGTAETLGRVALPANDTVTLSDYRTRYAQYRTDTNLQALHAKMPWITIWDDHEFADNAYKDGASNHNTATQGDWTTRKNNAAKAYHEWMPIRSPDATNLLKIYRKFEFGNLFSLHMLDTRIEGRTKQAYAYYGDPLDASIQPYAWADYGTGLSTGADAANKMMSDAQFSWFTTNIASATTKWQIVGNQDIMAKLWYPATVLQALGGSNPTSAITSYLTTKASNPTAAAGIPKLPMNMDAWDGYPINRETLLQTVKASGKKMVVLSGDSHNAWFNDIRTLDGTDKVGVEFAVTSVTSPGYESMGFGSLAPFIDGSGIAKGTNGTRAGLVDDVNYCETQKRGYLLMTVSDTQVKGEYVFVDTVRSKTYTAKVDKTITIATDLSATYS